MTYNVKNLHCIYVVCVTFSTFMLCFRFISTSDESHLKIGGLHYNEMVVLCVKNKPTAINYTDIENGTVQTVWRADRI